MSETNTWRDVVFSYHGREDVCKSSGRWVPQCRCTPADSTSCRRYTTRQSHTETWGCGICHPLRAGGNVRIVPHYQIQHKPSDRAPLPYDHRHLRRQRSTWRPHRQCNPSTVGSQRSKPTRERATVRRMHNSHEVKTNKYWCKGDERIVDSPRLCHTTRLECQLKTTTSHPEAHSVHVDVVLQRRSILRL
jgi:hypothetical protein